MSHLTVEVEIEHGRIRAIAPGKLPESGHGVLTLTPRRSKCTIDTGSDGLPVIRAEGLITSEQVREIEALEP
jgi:hypothetical protein